MSGKLYVGNIDYEITEIDLKELFGTFGPVKSARVILDRITGRSRGFGFVEMENLQDAKNAVAELDGSQNQGRAINVNIAKEKTTKYKSRMAPARF